MICPTCADAANRRAPADQHCGDPKCMCGHRTDRYQPPSGFGAPPGLYDKMLALFPAELPAPTPPPAGACPCGGTTTEHAPDCPVHPVRLRAVAAAATALLPAEVRAAGIHFAWADDTTQHTDTTKD